MQTSARKLILYSALPHKLQIVLFRLNIHAEANVASVTSRYCFKSRLRNRLVLKEAYEHSCTAFQAKTAHSVKHKKKKTNDNAARTTGSALERCQRFTSLCSSVYELGVVGVLFSNAFRCHKTDYRPLIKMSFCWRRTRRHFVHTFQFKPTLLGNSL